MAKNIIITDLIMDYEKQLDINRYNDIPLKYVVPLKNIENNENKKNLNWREKNEKNK